MPKILLTGYSGFVGSKVLSHFSEELDSIKCLGRSEPLTGEYVSGELNSTSVYAAALTDVDVVIHCAARVHIMNDHSADPLADFREVNTAGTINLAEQALAAGVKRFIFVSSIKVNGESTELDKPFTSNDKRCPEDFYGQSKSEAEELLLQLASDSDLEVVIIRPTLVYGPGVKANFASLLNLVSKGLPLPFGCITNNKRSLVSVSNLVDLIITCIEHPNAVNQVFLVSDDHDISTATMLRYMSQALNQPSRMLPIPLWCYSLAGKILGKQNIVNRLIGSLQVDITHTKVTLGWTPPQSIEDGFKATADHFLKIERNKE
jgi:nucleoside-diphosphate-sugar epimerase